MARLVWDTFPRSGSAWLAHTLRLSFPHSEIIWGGHRIATLRKESNVITCIRSPLNAVPSATLFFRKDNPEGMIDWYCRFIEGAIKNSERIFISSFDEIIYNPSEVMSRYAKRFFIPHYVDVSPDEIKLETMKTHAENLPRPISKERIAMNHVVGKLPSMKRALALYDEALSI